MKTGEVIRLLEGTGWELSRTRGSHRQYKHPDRPGKEAGYAVVQVA
jgi:predicted RNA binding protein YcfA (HicA-like mRNA interferase family)